MEGIVICAKCSAPVEFCEECGVSVVIGFDGFIMEDRTTGVRRVMHYTSKCLSRDTMRMKRVLL